MGPSHTYMKTTQTEMEEPTICRAPECSDRTTALKSPHTHICSRRHCRTLISFFNKLERNIHPTRDDALFHSEAGSQAEKVATVVA